MRYASFRTARGRSWGVVTDTGVYDIGHRHPDWPTLKEAIRKGALGRIPGLIPAEPVPDHTFADVIWDPVIPDPGKIICVGLNYDDHRAETKREPVCHPTIFARFANSQVGGGEPMLLPPESETFDFEGELALVIGSRCRRVAPEDAMSMIAGYSCYNDGSIREFQRHTSQFHPGKNWPGTGAFGPWLVTPDSFDDQAGRTIETRLNGVTVQSAALGDMIFGIPELLAYCSTWTELEPGDVIVTGTPGGIGAARTPPLWLRDGDTIEVEIEGIGVLHNRVRRE